MKHILQFILASLIFLTPMQAQTPQDKEDKVTLSRQTLLRIKRDPDAFIENAIRQLFQITASGVLTNDILDTREVMQTAQARNRLLSQLFVFDLDASLALEAAEISRQMPLLNSGQKTLLKSVLATSDNDRDGVLSLDEILAYAEKKAGAPNRNITAARELMTLDINDDGKVIPEEIAVAIANLVKSGWLENLDRSGVPKAPQVPCRFPAPSPNAKIVLVSGYKGAALSTVAVSGLGNETSLAVLEIEKGDTPLYIIATASGSIVWKLEGDVDRVERFVAGIGYSGVGVAGLGKKVVYFALSGAQNTKCMPRYFSDSASGDTERAKAQVSTILKRDVDHVIGTYKIGSVALPSGTLKKVTRWGWLDGTVILHSGKRYLQTTEGPKLLDWSVTKNEVTLETTLLRQLYRKYPGGVAELAVEGVIASSKAQAYDVMPLRADLLQLLQNGTLAEGPNGYYRIHKPFAAAPVGLHGIKFILAKGVEMPAGSLQDLFVISEETGECLAGTKCR